MGYICALAVLVLAVPAAGQDRPQLWVSTGPTLNLDSSWPSTPSFATSAVTISGGAAPERFDVRVLFDRPATAVRTDAAVVSLPSGDQRTTVRHQRRTPTLTVLVALRTTRKQWSTALLGALGFAQHACHMDAVTETFDALAQVTDSRNEQADCDFAPNVLPTVGADVEYRVTRRIGVTADVRIGFFRRADSRSPFVFRTGLAARYHF